MNPTQALTYCINITSKVWSVMESHDVVALWAVIRSYVLSGYTDIDVLVYKRILPAWERTKELIDKEVNLC